MELICIDTDILISYWRTDKSNKGQTTLVKLSSTYQIAVSVITVYELLRGDDSLEDEFGIHFLAR